MSDIKPVVMPEEFPARLRDSLLLLAGAIVVGAATGFLGVAFLKLLELGNGWRIEITEFLKNWPSGLGLAVLAVGTGLCASFAAWLVKRFSPNAVGSGIPYVEKILRGPGEPNHEFVLSVKFIGGFIALSAGMVLGREGPLVQIGAVIGERVGRLFKVVENAWKPLMAAGAGAGVATAFNAPVGGTLFILEEVLRKVTPVGFTLAAVAAISSAFVQRGLFGMGQVFHVADITAGPVENLPVYLVFGVLLGVLGVFYNKLLLGFLSPKCPLQKISAPLRALGIGAVVGVVAWFLPDDAGGGDPLTQQLLQGYGSIGLLLTIALARFFMGPLSYAAATPGGLFAPVVALGALLGAAAGLGLHSFAPALIPSPLAFAVAGMAAFFTASIRAPLTGIVICLEMTGCYELFLPMLTACAGSYLAATLLRSEPIYDALAKPVTT
ncbi:MAG: H(+)/Cl(-) exchange transporter ClcA [Terrimicrobiaceae bacterium]